MSDRAVRVAGCLRHPMSRATNGSRSGDESDSSSESDSDEVSVTHESEEEEPDEQLEKEQWHRLRKLTFQANKEKEQKRLDKVKAVWSKQRKELEDAIQQLTEELEDREEDLACLKQGEDEGRLPRGRSRCLRCLNGRAFVLLSSAVIVLNVRQIIMELTFPGYEQIRWVFWLDQGFLIFYIIEFALRAILYGIGDLLFGPYRIVCWNWLDLFIVVIGIIDQWILSFALGHGPGQGDYCFLRYVRFLRLARLARVLKIVKIFLTEDFSWTEGRLFQGFIMWVILVNSVLLGLQTDNPDFILWGPIENLLLLIFTFELSVRLRYHGCTYFYGSDDWPWNWLDFVIVVGGVVDQWMVPTIMFIQEALFDEHSSVNADAADVSRIMTTLRLARMLRILRLARLVRNMPPLFDLATGVLMAMQGMFWVLVLTALLLYVFAILCVRLIGEGIVFPTGQAPPEIVQLFPNIGQSMFVLFIVMNGDMGPLDDLFVDLPQSKFAFAMFIVVSNWAILAIFTAVVSENMIKTTDDRRAKEEEQMAEFKTDRSVVKLNDIFNRLDTTNDKMITKSELDRLLADEDQSAEFMDAAGLSEKDLKDLFKILSVQKDDLSEPVISYADFIDSLKKESKKANERSMMRFEKRIRDLEDHVRQWLKQHAQPSPRSAQSLNSVPRASSTGSSAKFFLYSGNSHLSHLSRYG